MTSNDEIVSVPLLVGKTVSHFFISEEIKSKVVSQVPGFPQWFNSL